MYTLLLFGFFITGLEAQGSVSGEGAGKDKCYSNITEFPCAIPQKTKNATNVHELTMGDIDVVIGLGDSITAGVGVLARQNPANDPRTEYPQTTFVMGGEQGIITLPNIMLMYNKNLTGYSTSVDRGYNYAVTGASTAGLKVQADKMFNETKAHGELWKLIHIFMGHNDFCDSVCLPGFEVSQIVKNIINVTREIKAKMPNTFVNIIAPFDIVFSAIYYNKFGSNNPLCQYILPVSCTCLYGTGTKIDPKEMQKKENEFYQLLVTAIDEENFDSEDFAVVVNALGASINMNFTQTLFAPDCFHADLSGHEQFAVALFNILLTKVQEKETVINLPSKLQCPENMTNPYLKTKRNSGFGKWGMEYASSGKFDPAKVKCRKP